MWEKIRTNWKSGITVALVSIPLSISLAIASGASPAAGIITAVWAGLMASIFGGSNYNIVGPAGALSGILAGFALTHGAELLPTLAVFTGVFVIVAWVLRLERYLVFVPAPAIHGFTLGVAILIAFGQMNSALGISGLPVHEKFGQNLMETISNMQLFSLPTFVVFWLFLICMFFVLKNLPKVPPVIAVAPAGLVLGFASVNNLVPWDLAVLGQRFPNLSMGSWSFGSLSWDPSLVVAGLTVALVAILETMLSAKIADTMTGTKYNKRSEMLGLGLANIASGLFGGLPATGVLARTSLNVKSGATDKMSGTINSIAVAIISILFLSYFKYVPMAVIAAILVFVAVRMVEKQHFEKLWKYERIGFWLALLVGLVTVWEDPIVGILMGTAVSLIILVEKMSRGQFELVLNSTKQGIVHRTVGDKLEEIKQHGETLVYSIKGQLLHLNAESHVRRFEHDLAQYKNVVLRLRELYFLDLEGVECISEIIDVVSKSGKTVVVTGVNPVVAEMLAESRQYEDLRARGLVFEKSTQALKYLGHKIK